MKLALTLAAAAYAMLGGASAAETKDPLAAMGWIVGDWIGVGEGEPGISASERHAAKAHNGNFIIIQGRAVYPKQEKNKTGEVHTSIDIWSFDKQRGVLMLRQFDSLGFASTYVQDKQASAKGRIILVSENLENVPAGWSARYTYTFVPPNEYHELFELAASGQGLRPYVSGRFLRAEH